MAFICGHSGQSYQMTSVQGFYIGHIGHNRDQQCRSSRSTPFCWPGIVFIFRTHVFNSHTNRKLLLSPPGPDYLQCPSPDPDQTQTRPTISTPALPPLWGANSSPHQTGSDINKSGGQFSGEVWFVTSSQ